MKPRRQTPVAARSGRMQRPSQQRARAQRAQTRLSPISKLKDILVPTDFSKHSENAIKYALDMARRFDAKVTLLYVVEPPVFTDFQAMPMAVDERKMTEAARSKLNSVRDELGEDAVYVKDVRAVVGKPFEQITSLARGLRQDLIVIATQGRTGLKHVLLGSTAEKVVRHAKCPVLVVRKA